MPQLPVEGVPPAPDEAPDPKLLSKDPMGELFGPGSGVRMHGESDDQIPDEVRLLVEEHGLSKMPFNCMLKEIKTDAEGASTLEFVKGFTRGFPTPDFIAREYGPGNYVMIFTWQVKEEDGVRRMMREEIPVNISEKAAVMHKKNRMDKKIKETIRQTAQVREALVEEKLEGEMIKALVGEKGLVKGDPATSAKQYLAEIAETAKMLGFQQAPVALPRIEWDKILPALMTGVSAFLTIQQQAEQSRRDEFNKMLMLMMQNSQQANGHLIEIMKTQSGQGSGNMAIREFKDMVLGALDIKEALGGGGRETLGDKIFRLIESVAPSVLSIAAATANNPAAAAKNPAVGMAKTFIETNPDFQALKGQPEELKKVIDNMDQTYGYVQTDHILKTMGWERPATCPRREEWKDPAPDNVSDAETTPVA